MSSRKITAVVSLILAGTVLFAGCGKSNETTDDNVKTSEEKTTQSEFVADDVQESQAVVASLPESTEKTDTVSTSTKSEDTTQTKSETQKAEVNATTKSSSAKNITVYKSEGQRKIWAGVVGEIYVLFKNIETPNGNGLKGQVYELYVDAGDGYTVWADGYWELNSSKTELKLTPKHQSENGNIGVAEGKTKTYKADNGTFKVEFTFEQGGKSSIKFNPAKDAV